ncbi:TetR/AcrR family transcriptional regulator C-terminal domain-containing protein [Rhizobium tumorigenes]|uniref:TetR/AcrR family transcriptional regulator C-terminal domain-containing protein n=1 Tax=Rhizobium tumorigenes TaxID=2041385 RepID=UPI00242029E5|nr:TetR/AcrR family transcriptional regulator C-terminal domain-containing protein [Rhizobium tumorigenes]WFS02805.1 TetR/AcrR family transcriptional regulator C-terminal domain-containing protein [Rhizobium tumorigenes]
MGVVIVPSDALQTSEFSPRQNAVLEQALRLLVDGGEKALTTSGVARAANCSKESLYKWFGDRDGLLSAMIAHQASKVRTFERNGERLTATSLHDHLVIFARDLLEVLAGDVSLALNRLAIGQSNRDGSKLGKLLLDRGRRQIDRRASGLIDAGKRAGLLRFDDANEAYHTLYGLVVSDLHVRMLLGEPSIKDGAQQAERAVSAFLRLYGTEKVSADAAASV